MFIDYLQSTWAKRASGRLPAVPEPAEEPPHGGRHPRVPHHAGAVPHRHTRARQREGQLPRSLARYPHSHIK